MLRALLLALLLTTTANAQWQILDAHTTEDFRGVSSVGKGIVWISGTNGTVLRSEDAGYLWQHCTTPPGADHLDFRGIQAFDSDTAIVMSSGKGDLSRLYKTTDGCQTWKLVAANPDKEGFWDSFQVENSEHAYILGDSVSSKLRLWEWREGWEERELELSYEAQGSTESNEGSFAASNSVLQKVTTNQIDPKWKYELRWASNTPSNVYISMVLSEQTATCEPCRLEHRKIEVPMSGGSAKSGIFSFSFRDEFAGIAVGGNYEKAADRTQAAATTSDGGNTWKLPTTPPHGYRSAVAYDPTTKTWITVGPNGTDISTDDGHNWQALKPSASDASDADKNWNALSLPYVVGPHGHVGMLQPDALKH